ncbi:MAG: serine hydrolase domain-containing protein, partial [Parvularculaceae bacterium]
VEGRGMNFNRRFFVGGAALAGAAASGPAVAKSGDRKPLAALRDYMERHRAEWGIPGMTATLVGRDGFEGIVHSGWADIDRRVPVGPQHLFQIGSITKMMTALAAWSLIEEGKLSPDARLKDVLKGVSVAGGESITLRDLLNHTSGLPADSAIFPDGGLKSGFKPGTRWTYSNSGYLLAGMMAEAASGVPYPELVETRVLKKLGMNDSVGALRVADRSRYATGYEPALTDRLNPRPAPMTPTPWVDSDSPAGCVASTAADMAKFLRFLLGLAGGKGGAVLSDETAKRFLAEPADAPGWAPSVRYGNGVARVEIDGRKYLHHTGGMVSFCSALHVDAEAGVAAFASANIHYSLNYRPRDITVYACGLLRALSEGLAAPAPRAPRLVLENPQRFAGVFTAADGDKFEIAAGEKKISLRRKGRETAMQEAAPGLFACLDPDLAITGIVIETEGEGAAAKAVRAWAGEKEFLASGRTNYQPPAPAELRALAGRYDNDDRWAGPLYVYARSGKIWIGNAEPLTKLPNGEWRPGEEWSPERFRFDGFINGRPQRLLFSGVPFVRRFS